MLLATLLATTDAPAQQTALQSLNVLAFHGDRQRLGWSSRETELTPASVAGPAFGPLWSSPALDTVDLDGVSYTPHQYASPLYVDDAQLSGGARAALVIAATSNGFVYAIAAGPGAAPGTILWRRQLGRPSINRHLDGGIPMGILSTPIVDLEAQPQRLYAVAADEVRGWQAFALDLSSGEIMNGWPVQIDDGEPEWSGSAPAGRRDVSAWRAESQPGRRLAVCPVRKLRGWRGGLAGRHRHAPRHAGQRILRSAFDGGGR